MNNRINCSLLGFPDDEGIKNVGGRLGALSGPSAFRKIWEKLKLKNPAMLGVRDLGDLPVENHGLQQKHQMAARMIEKAHPENTSSASVAIGGSHDYAYAHLKGLSSACRRPVRLGCINVDAHFDLRDSTPVFTSGSPFYEALESRLLEPTRLIEFGIQTQANSEELRKFARSRKIPTFFFHDLRFGKAVSRFKLELKKLEAKCDVILLSLDLDAMAEAYCPGVSAPQAEGFTASEALAFCEIAGKSKKVISLGIYELSPPYDRGDQSARVAATCAYRFFESKMGL